MAKILIVDDSEMFRKVYTLKLQTAGYEVVTALDGNEGLAKARETNPNLILLDIMMPNLNGFEFLKLKAEDAAIKSIPVIVYSTLRTEGDIELVKKLGANDYLPKDQVDIVDMITAIQKYVK